MKRLITVIETTKEDIGKMTSSLPTVSSIWKESDFTYNILADGKAYGWLHVISPARRHYTAKVELPLSFDLESEESTFPIRFHNAKGKLTTPYQLDDFFKMLTGLTPACTELDQIENSVELLSSTTVKVEETSLLFNLHYAIDANDSLSIDTRWLDLMYPSNPTKGIRLWIRNKDRGNEMLAMLGKSKIVDIENKFIQYYPELNKLKPQHPTTNAPTIAAQEKPDVDPLRTLVEERLSQEFVEYKLDEPFEDIPGAKWVEHDGVEPLEGDNGLVSLHTWYHDQFARIRVHALFKGRDKIYNVFIQTKPMSIEFANESASFLNDIDFVNDVIYGLPILEVVRRNIYDAESERRHERNNQIRERNGRLSFPGFSTLPPLEAGVLEIPEHSIPNPWRSRLGSQLRQPEQNDVTSLVNRVINKDIPLSDITKLDIKITRDTEGNFNVAGSFSTTVNITSTASRRPGYGASRERDDGYLSETREERRARRQRERRLKD